MNTNKVEQTVIKVRKDKNEYKKETNIWKKQTHGGKHETLETGGREQQNMKRNQTED